MKFERRYEDLIFDDNTLRIQELSAREFDEVSKIENEHEQVITLIYTSLEIKPDTMDEMFHWPARVINELSAACLSLNGLTQTGN